MEFVKNIEEQNQRLNYLIPILLSETNFKIKIPEDFIKIENQYLQERLKSFSITNINQLQPLSYTHPFLSETKKIKNINKICLWKGNITKLQIDAIVNAGNNGGLGCFQPTHVCIDNQIHSEAGTGLRMECNEYMKKNK